MAKVNLPKLDARDVGRPRYRINNPLLEGKMYQFRQPLWDVYGAVVASVLALRRLFTVPFGQAYTPIGGAAITKTFYHTNMTQAGVLPSPQKFFAKSISVAVRSDIVLIDSLRFLDDTLLSFLVSGREYLKAHAFKLGAAGGPFGASTGIITNSFPDKRQTFTFAGDLGEVIEQLQSVAVDVDPTQVVDAASAGVYTTATAAVGGTGINCKVYLDGLLNREVN